MPLSQRERMLAGESYNSRDPELLALAHRSRALLATFAALPSTDADARHRTLVELLGLVGTGVWIEPPFFCDYGRHIEIGDDTFVNVNCVFLDAAPIRIGANVLVGPGVQLITVSHPVNATERLIPSDARGPDQAPYHTFARSIVVGDGAWIGAGSIVFPGVTIGANAVIGAGSLVTADVPPDCLAYGQPCRVQRSLDGIDAVATNPTPSTRKAAKTSTEGASNRLSDLQTALVERLLSPICAPNPNPAISSQVRHGYRVDGYSVVLFESRPGFRPPHEWHDRDVAKFRFVRSRGVWQLFCQFRDLKWHTYEPLPESPSLEVLVSEVRKDPTGIFWG